tara:strand:- start:251 stop:511 length:261 start_codon:yes stop_codon:yes gene_type:complete
MSIIKAKYCEVEIQEQTMPEAGAKYMVVLSYEPEDKFSKEIISVVLTNNKPKIKETIDVGDAVLNKNVPTTEKPKPITTPEGLFGE